MKLSQASVKAMPAKKIGQAKKRKAAEEQLSKAQHFVRTMDNWADGIQARDNKASDISPEIGTVIELDSGDNPKKWLEANFQGDQVDIEYSRNISATDQDYSFISGNDSKKRYFRSNINVVRSWRQPDSSKYTFQEVTVTKEGDETFYSYRSGDGLGSQIWNGIRSVARGIGGLAGAALEYVPLQVKVGKNA